MPAVIIANPAPVFLDSNQQAVHSNATITTNGSQIYSGFGNKQLTLVVNIKASPTGTAPTLTVTMQEVDPGDNATVINTAISTAALTTIGTAVISLPATMSGAVKVSWVVGGTSPSFTQVYVTLSAKVPGIMLGVDSSGVEHGLLVDSLGQPILGNRIANVIKTTGFSIISRNETTQTNMNYTVTTGKDLYASFFGGAAFVPLPIILRLKVNGALKLMVLSGRSESNTIALPMPAKIATGGDAITVTSEAQVPHGDAWAGFTGIEF